MTTNWASLSGLSGPAAQGCPTSEPATCVTSLPVSLSAGGATRRSSWPRPSWRVKPDLGVDVPPQQERQTKLVCARGARASPYQAVLRLADHLCSYLLVEWPPLTAALTGAARYHTCCQRLRPPHRSETETREKRWGALPPASLPPQSPSPPQDIFLSSHDLPNICSVISCHDISSWEVHRGPAPYDQRHHARRLLGAIFGQQYNCSQRDECFGRVNRHRRAEHSHQRERHRNHVGVHQRPGLVLPAGHHAPGRPVGNHHVRADGYEVDRRRRCG